MKAKYHWVHGDLNVDEVLKETNDPFEWFPELRNMFDHFDIKRLEVELEIPSEYKNLKKKVKRIYYEILK